MVAAATADDDEDDDDAAADGDDVAAAATAAVAAAVAADAIWCLLSELSSAFLVSNPNLPCQLPIFFKPSLSLLPPWMAGRDSSSSR